MGNPIYVHQSPKKVPDLLSKGAMEHDIVHRLPIIFAKDTSVNNITPLLLKIIKSNNFFLQKNPKKYINFRSHTFHPSLSPAGYFLILKRIIVGRRDRVCSTRVIFPDQNILFLIQAKAFRQLASSTRFGSTQKRLTHILLCQ